jgi:hypothetical protein
LTSVVPTQPSFLIEKLARGRAPASAHAETKREFLMRRPRKRQPVFCALFVRCGG